MQRITLAEYNTIHKDFKGTLQGTNRKTMLILENNATVLLIEGKHFEITDDLEIKSWDRPNIKTIKYFMNN